MSFVNSSDFREWMLERTQLGGRSRSVDLYRDWTEWLVRRYGYAGNMNTHTAFGRTLAELGVERVRLAAGNFYALTLNS